MSDKECDHIISLAKESGTSGLFNYEADLDAVLAIAGEVTFGNFNLFEPVVSYLELRLSA